MVNRPEHDGLVVRGLARRFGPRWAVAGVDLDVPSGGALMVLGANGSGKTTLLRCLATALAPHAGDVWWRRRPLWADRAALRPDVVLLTHATRLYEDLSARDNLLVWARLAGMTGLDPRAALDRVGIPADRTEPVRTFSAGMKRRVALARALLRTPSLFLLDEPLAALDPPGRALIGEVVAEQRARGVTIVLASHHPETTGPWCDAAVRLERGRVVWSGPPSAASVEAAP
jgi:heme exporter protein A